MIRVPPKLAQAWNDAEEGSSLGELVFTKGGSKKGKVNGRPIKTPPSLTIQCDERFLLNDNKNDFPLEYSMEAMTKRVPSLHPFSRDADSQITIHGTVARTANLQASRNDARYRQLCKTRLLQTNVHNHRFVKPVESSELSVRKSLGNKNRGFGTDVQSFGQRLKEDRENPVEHESNRKRKYQDTPTRSVIFELFSQAPYWTVKEIKEESGNKPEKEIRAILHEIGDYHRSGEHKNMWALKREYALQTKEES